MHHRYLIASSIALSVTVMAGCSSSPTAAAKPGSDKSADSAAPVVKVAAVKVQRKSLKRTTTQPGEIEAFEAAPLYAKASGYVEKLHVDIGDEVKVGDLLVTLFIPEVQQELKGKEAQVAVA